MTYNTEVKKILEHLPLTLYGLISVGVVLLLGFSTYTWNQYATIQAELTVVRDSSADMQERLETSESENEQMHKLLEQASVENEAFGQRVEELAKNVTFLDKASKTDRELLQKYSSVYFLSENYVPDPLVPVNDELLARGGSNVMIHGNVFPFLEKMMEAAEKDGLPLRVLSAYRSFGTQSSLKSGYTITYGSGTANTFSADQGYSEHQLGTTVDFTTPENLESLTTAFRKTPQYSWLIRHAHEYGFALSYPEGNSFFQFEPWHWRFVGIDLATYLYNDNKYFYDLDQREINPYLVRIFD